MIALIGTSVAQDVAHQDNVADGRGEGDGVAFGSGERSDPLTALQE